MISIVSPVYKAEKILPELVRRLENVLTKQGEPFEVIFIEDRGPDQSWSVIQELAKKYEFIRGFRLSRNFGQHLAISAGIEKSIGDRLIVMDCDLQDDPAYIPQLLDLNKKGYDIVYTVKKLRKHGFFKNLSARLWHNLFNWLSESTSMSSEFNIGSYSLITRKVADAFLKIDESKRHYLLILRWLGFSATILEIEHRDRFEGKSSYTFKKLAQHALIGILSESNRLLYVSIALGLGFVLTSFLSAIALIILYFVHGFKAGWASQIVVMLACTGVILVMLGVLGAYIGMVFEQVKHRPLYIVDDATPAKKI